MNEYSFMAIAKAIVDAEPQQFALVFGEADENTESEKEANYFIKREGKRFGRDIKLYDFMCQVMGDGGALAIFLQEVILPLDHESKAYKISAKMTKEWGATIFKGKRLVLWNELFCLPYPL